jgi:hypothetical protein
VAAMTLYKRRIVAYIIGKLILDKQINKIFDQTTSSYNEIVGEVTPTRINVYDTERNEMMTGSGDEKGISLFDFATSKFIELRLDGDKFDGFDFESKKAFYGDLNESTVSFFDFQDSKHHYYVMLEEGVEITQGFGLMF